MQCLTSCSLPLAVKVRSTQADRPHRPPPHPLPPYDAAQALKSLEGKTFPNGAQVRLGRLD